MISCFDRGPKLYQPNRASHCHERRVDSSVHKLPPAPAISAELLSQKTQLGQIDLLVRTEQGNGRFGSDRKKAFPMRRVLLAIASMVSVAASSHGAPLTRLPAEFRRDGIYLPVSVNGRAPTLMKLSLGSDQTEIAGSSDGLEAADLQIGSFTAHALTVRVHAMPASIAGLVGEDVLGDRVLMIRPEQHAVFLSDPVALSQAVVASR